MPSKKRRAAAPKDLTEPTFEESIPRRRRRVQQVQVIPPVETPRDASTPHIDSETMSKIADMIFQRMQSSSLVTSTAGITNAIVSQTMPTISAINSAVSTNTCVSPSAPLVTHTSALPEMNTSQSSLLSPVAHPCTTIPQQIPTSTLMSRPFPESQPTLGVSNPVQSDTLRPIYCVSSTATSATVNSASSVMTLNHHATSLNQFSNNDNGIDSFNFINHTLPLGYHVKDNIRNEIFAEKYIDLATLLPNFALHDESVLGESSTSILKMSSKGKQKQILGIIQWCNAFDIFMAIYIEKYPGAIASLLKYSYTIKNMAQRHGFSVAKEYDESFRQARPKFKLNWSLVNDELWRDALANKGTTKNYVAPVGLKQGKQPFRKSSQQGSSKYPTGFCWAFCRSGECTASDCKHKHQCVKCGQKHATDTCKKSKPNGGKG